MTQDLKDKKLREELVLVSRRINSIGLNQGTSGNLSVRSSNGILITPSSLPFEDNSTPTNREYRTGSFIAV